jgi:HTH-type transcriptional regulator/antitoxin HigA
VITNERQYKITRNQLDKLKAALQLYYRDYVTKNLGDDILATTELQALESEITILEDQLHEYEELRSGSISSLEASSLAELPGMLIRARIAQRLSQKELADLLGMKEQQIQRYESQEYSGVSLHRLKEIADALKLTIKETAEISAIPDPKKTGASKELYWRKFPIGEIYRRGWFEGFTGSIDEAKANADILVRDFIMQASKKPLAAFHHKSVRSGLSADEFSLFSWECRVINLATRVKLEPKYSAQLLDPAWFSNLCKASSKDNGPLIAKAMLKEVGIPLIIEPHLTNTYLDGAALLSAEIPIVGMTLRYDRLDNFWFVLLHELFHVIKHLRAGKLDTIFDDLDSESQDTIEKEADKLAEEAMIPVERWMVALPRYVRSVESVSNFATDLGINPAIVAGRIRYEAKNYTILNELVGQGLVRKHFPEVNFGV